MGSHIDVLLRELSGRQYGLVGRRQVHSLGVTPHELDHRIERGEWASLSAEVLELVGSSVDDLGKKAMAAVLDGPPGAVLSHRSAAAWWGIPGFDLGGDVHVTAPRQGVRYRTRHGIVHFHKDMPLDETTALRGVPVTSPGLTMFHLAGKEHPGRVERAVDNAWAMRLLDGADLERLLVRLAARGRNGIRTMRGIVAARGGDYVPPESGNEARFMQILEEAGIERPRRQVVLGGHTAVGRSDFYWERFRAVCEVQSVRYHSSLLDRASDEDGGLRGRRLPLPHHLGPRDLGGSGVGHREGLRLPHRMPPLKARTSPFSRGTVTL